MRSICFVLVIWDCMWICKVGGYVCRSLCGLWFLLFVVVVLFMLWCIVSMVWMFLMCVLWSGCRLLVCGG